MEVCDVVVAVEVSYSEFVVICVVIVFASLILLVFGAVVSVL